MRVVLTTVARRGAPVCRRRISQAQVFLVTCGAYYDGTYRKGCAMGLDAFVPCNCLEKGLLSKPLEPFELDDVYRDEEGYIASRTLDRYRRELGYDAYLVTEKYVSACN